MPTNEVPAGDVRRAALAKLLQALLPHQNPDVCTSGPIFEDARLIIGMPIDDLRQMGKVRELFGPYDVLFGVESGRYFSCSSPDCARIFPRYDPRVEGEDPYCVCGAPLRPFNNVEDLMRPGFELNLVLDGDNAIQAFTCGKAVDCGPIRDALLGPSHTGYREILCSLDEATRAVCSYFGDESERLTTPVYLAASGGVLNEKKGDLRYLAAVCAPLLQAAVHSTGGRLVCVNHRASAMFKVNLMLGFDVISTAGPFAYLGLKDVTLALLVYQKLGPAALADLFRVLGRLAN